jgi:hypothetical protein
MLAMIVTRTRRSQIPPPDLPTAGSTGFEQQKPGALQAANGSALTVPVFYTPPIKSLVLNVD